MTVTEYGRDVPAPGYLTSSAAYPTTIRDQGDISQLREGGEEDEE